MQDPPPATTATTATIQQPAQPLPDAAPSSAGAVGSAVLALLLVVALILALAWLARRMPGAAASSNKSLRVVASLAVGQRERVMVVDVGGTQLLLGVGPGGTRTLHTLAEPLPVQDAPAPFAQLLAQQFGKKS
ncbi:flagellar biosynthetic protein FliO [Lysobacter sp. D1-1-M9]|uniref:flagellar biosynthetic protein FliO n=1 Tax=Novilysobacter longmucuonensis TaxID=3098603 RepID=UPI0039835B93